MDSDHLDTLVRNARSRDTTRLGNAHLRQLAVALLCPRRRNRPSLPRTRRRRRRPGTGRPRHSPGRRRCIASRQQPGPLRGVCRRHHVGRDRASLLPGSRGPFGRLRPCRSCRPRSHRPRRPCSNGSAGNVTEEEVAQAIGVPLADLAAARLLHGAHYAINIDYGGGDSTGGGDDPVGSWERHEALRAAVAA